MQQHTTDYHDDTWNTFSLPKVEYVSRIVYLIWFDNVSWFTMISAFFSLFSLSLSIFCIATGKQTVIASYIF